MTKLEKVLYTAKAHTTGGRDGASRTSDGRLDVTLSSPGTSGTGTNPEQLFAAGYAACFGSALALVARRQRLDTGPVAITAHVSIGPAGAGYGLAVELVADIPGLPREQGEALLRAAHMVCPYSNATRGNIVVDLTLA